MLSDMFRNITSGKQKNTQEQEGDQQLLLILSWVDQLKREPESLTSDRERLNSTAALADKYGKCKETFGRGAFGTVRLSHKCIDGAGEQLYAVKEFFRRPEENEKKYNRRLTFEF
jgi:protein-serine/threonine kinase